MSADDGAVEALLCLDEVSVEVALVVFDPPLPLTAVSTLPLLVFARTRALTLDSPVIIQASEQIVLHFNLGLSITLWLGSLSPRHASPSVKRFCGRRISLQHTERGLGGRDSERLYFVGACSGFPPERGRETARHVGGD